MNLQAAQNLAKNPHKLTTLAEARDVLRALFGHADERTGKTVKAADWATYHRLAATDPAAARRYYAENEKQLSPILRTK